MVLAHRGASATHTENTLEAFVAAREQGAHGIELDVRRTADGVLVVCHDALLDDGRAIGDTNHADLPDHVPTLADALDVSEGMCMNVEIKNLPGDPDHVLAPLLVEDLVGMLTERDLAGSTLISSFHIDSVDQVRAQAPELRTGWLVLDGAAVGSLVERTAAHGHQAINPHASLVDRGFVERSHAAGLQVMVWTVDDLQRAQELIDLGVDAIITNTPEPVRALVDAAQ
jgi:glycerophosphoryl diester phosphodiesterase